METFIINWSQQVSKAKSFFDNTSKYFIKNIVINTHQIFIVYWPGMFGYMLASLLTNWKKKLIGTKGNAHSSGFKQLIKNFHDVHHANTVLQIDEKQRIDFFQPLKYILDRKCVHALSSYKFLQIPFDRYFKSFTVVTLVPEHENTYKSWAHRHVYTASLNHRDDTQKEIKHKIKNLKKQLLHVKENNYDIRFDPINFFDFERTQKLITDICVHAKCDRIRIPYENWLQHVSKAKPFFDNTSK